MAAQRTRCAAGSAGLCAGLAMGRAAVLHGHGGRLGANAL